MSRTGIIYHENFLSHKTGDGHPERAERLISLMNHLKTTDIFTDLVTISVKPGKIGWVEQIHPESYIKSIQTACQPGLQYLDSDTVVSELSYQVALLAVGGVVEACQAVMKNEIDNAFCAVRPPGHHAEPTRAMGFCLFNNVAIAARYLQNEHEIKKVSIVDWDVHHGNGTQAAFYDDPTVQYISIHQHPLYPGTGSAEEQGKDQGEGANINLPSPPGFGDKEYLEVFANQIAPALRSYSPDFILISAGFDAHRDDPLANMQVTEVGFARMTEVVKSIAKECCNGHIISLLEGGYDLNALSKSVELHIKKLIN